MCFLVVKGGVGLEFGGNAPSSPPWKSNTAKSGEFGEVVEDIILANASSAPGARRAIFLLNQLVQAREVMEFDVGKGGVLSRLVALWCCVWKRREA